MTVSLSIIVIIVSIFRDFEARCGYYKTESFFRSGGLQILFFFLVDILKSFLESGKHVLSIFFYIKSAIFWNVTPYISERTVRFGGILPPSSGLNR
jgi:hypothetical protein